MLFGLLAAAAAAAPQPVPSRANDPDLRCMVAMSITLGGIEDGVIEGGEEDEAAITGLVMYFAGKIDGRLPGFDYSSAIATLVESPRYLEETLLDDLERCGDEAQERGETLIDLGERVKDLAPLAPGARTG